MKLSCFKNIKTPVLKQDICPHLLQQNDTPVHISSFKILYIHTHRKHTHACVHVFPLREYSEDSLYLQRLWFPSFLSVPPFKISIARRAL